MERVREQGLHVLNVIKGLGMTGRGLGVSVCVFVCVGV